MDMNALSDHQRRQVASVLLGIPTAKIDDVCFSVDKSAVVIHVKLRGSVETVHISGGESNRNPVE